MPEQATAELTPPPTRKRSMLLYILLALAAIVIILIVVVAFQPADFRLERSTTIDAPAAAVYPQINDLHNWKGWSPWANLDPEMKTTYEGPAAGPGASYSWNGNSKVGEGKMTITDSQLDRLVRLSLAFERPMKATNESEFTLEPAGNQTKVVWSMKGRNGFVGKAFGLLVNMDKLVGKDFEKGLDGIRVIAEEQSPK